MFPISTLLSTTAEALQNVTYKLLDSITICKDHFTVRFEHT